MVILHVQITRVTSIYHSYFIYNIFLENKSLACIFLNIFYFKLNAFVFCFFNLYVFNIFFFYVESMSVMSL